MEATDEKMAHGCENPTTFFFFHFRNFLTFIVYPNIHWEYDTDAL